MDEAALRGLIRDIDKEHNADVLKVGYFARRGGPGLPQRDGLRILKEAVADSEAGTRRWCLLQWVCGFAGLHVGYDTHQIGLDAYAALLDRFATAEKCGARDVVERAVADLVSFAGAAADNYGLRRDVRVRDLLQKAFTVYLGWVEAGPPFPREVGWMKALEKGADCPRIREAAERALGSAEAARSYALLATTGAALAKAQPDRALTLLEEARWKLPAGEKTHARCLFRGLEELRQAKGDTVGAIAAQRDLVEASGEGYADLCVLYAKAKQVDGLDAVCAALAKPEADEKELLGSAEALQALAGGSASNEPTRRVAAKLLNGYLRAARARTPVQELRARVVLSQLCLVDGRAGEAQAALNTDHLGALPDTPLSRYYREAARRLRDTLGTDRTGSKEQKETKR